METIEENLYNLHQLKPSQISQNYFFDNITFSDDGPAAPEIVSEVKILLQCITYVIKLRIIA